MMTEHEKLLAGQDYDYRDPELQSLLAKGRKLVSLINTTQDMDERAKAIKELFGKVGTGLVINGSLVRFMVVILVWAMTSSLMAIAHSKILIGLPWVIVSLLPPILSYIVVPMRWMPASGLGLAQMAASI